MNKCEYCNKEFESSKQINGHKVYCKFNPKYEERIQKLSSSMKESIKKGISKGWLIFKQKRSFPEIFIKKVIETNELDKKYLIVENFRFQKYLLDFAIIDLKLDIEVDGKQHYDNDENIKHDKIRNEVLIAEGWKVYRICWSQFCKNTKQEIQKLLDYIENIKNNSSYFYDIDEIKLKKIKVYKFNDEYYKNLYNQIINCGIEIHKENLKAISNKTNISQQRIVRVVRKFSDLLPKINRQKNLNPRVRKYKNREEYFINKKKLFNESQQKYISQILQSDINFSKLGWVNQVAKIINKPPQKVGYWMKEFMNDFYSKCYKR